MQDGPLFTTFEHNTCSNVPIDYMHIRKMLGDLKERAKLQKRLYTHLFRHSRATYYANFLTEQQAKRYFGRSGGSTMVARYTHLVSKDIDNAIFKANGMNVNDIRESLQPKFSEKQCEKCHLKNEITAKYCTRCGTFLDKLIVQKSIENGEANEDLNTLQTRKN
jgi:ribosomal protein L40E